MKIAVIGTGYVGLVSGVCFSETGVEVTCIDNNQEKIDKLNLGEIPIYEPTLDILMKRNFSEGRLRFTIDLRAGIENAEIIFLALPTPESEDGSADLSYVLKMAETLSGIITSYKVIVNKSTVPVGTAAKVQAIFNEKCKVKVDVISNPEFLREGFAVEDFLKPDRIVIGSSNAFLAMKISFMNEMANIAEKVGANIELVRKGIGTDHRIGGAFLYAGLGYGGSCFPKDVKAIQKIAIDNDYDFKLVNSVLKVNQLQREKFFNKIKSNIDLKGKKIALWGLSFKPNTDDIREAPALYIIEKLIESDAIVSAYDPEGMPNVKKQLGAAIHYCQNMYDALDGADALVIVTEWTVFRTPDFPKMKSLMTGNVIFDGRNLFDLEEMKAQGYKYFSIGRNTVTSE